MPMNHRQLEVQKIQADDELHIIKELKQVYAQASKDCAAKISQLSARTDMENLQSIIYQKQYQEAVKKQLDGIVQTLQTDNFTTISGYLAKSYDNGFFGTLYDLQGQGVPLCYPIDQKQVVKALQTDSKISNGMYSRLGEDVDDLKKGIRVELSRGIANGQSWNEIAGHIANWQKTPFAKAYNNSVRIARTEGHRVQQSATLDCQRKAIERGADVVKQWDSTLDGATRPDHVELDGQTADVDEPFSVGGMTAMFPGDFGDPSEDCNCRCCLLQRAKWALASDGESTKWNGDTGELVRLDSKDYDEFRGQADEVNNAANTAVTIDEVSTFDELSKYMQDKYQIDIDDTVKDLNFDACKETLTGVESVMQEYPALANNIQKVSTKKTGVMCCNGKEIFFNPTYYKDTKKFEEGCKQSVENHWWAKNSSMASVGAHETGHAVERLLLDTDKHYEYDWQRTLDWNSSTKSKEIVSQALKNVKKTPYGKGKVNAELVKGISGYATKKPCETLAESFADVYANGDNANPVSKEIKKVTAEKYAELLKGG